MVPIFIERGPPAASRALSLQAFALARRPRQSVSEFEPVAVKYLSFAAKSRACLIHLYYGVHRIGAMVRGVTDDNAV